MLRFSPSSGLSGDIFFNDAKEFTVNSTKGHNFLWIATNAIGHSIGLEHSSVPSSVMYPWYTGKKTALSEDDIEGIQSLYGK